MAAPHQIIGPFRVYGHWSVFEVTGVRPSIPQPFANVRSTIRRMLQSEARSRTLSRFVLAWQQKWRSLTDCSTGYVVYLCKQYAGKPLTPVQTPLAGA